VYGLVAVVETAAAAAGFLLLNELADRSFHQ
jgi:hypothetical protein